MDILNTYKKPDPQFDFKKKTTAPVSNLNIEWIFPLN